MPKFNPMRRRVPVLKRLIPSVRKYVARLTWTDGFAVVHSRDARFLVNHRNFVDRQIAFYDDYEFDQLEYLINAIKTYVCTTFIDIGANIGYYCVHVGNETSVSRVIAFEPDARNFDQMHANFFLNRLSGRVESRQAAVSDRAGKIAFETYPDTSTGQSRVAASRAGTAVDAVRLDDVLQLDATSIAIKIDIEGHEAVAVEGMRTLLTSNRCFVQAEVYPSTLKRFSAAMIGLGYREIHKIGDDHYFTNFPFVP